MCTHKYARCPCLSMFDYLYAGLALVIPPSARSSHPDPARRSVTRNCIERQGKQQPETNPTATTCSSSGTKTSTLVSTSILQQHVSVPQRKAVVCSRWAPLSVGSRRMPPRTRTLAAMRRTKRTSLNHFGVREPCPVRNPPTRGFCCSSETNNLLCRHDFDSRARASSVPGLDRSVPDIQKISSAILCAAHVHRR